MSVVNVPGIEHIFAGGKVLVIPPLALGDLEQLLDPINDVMNGAMDKAAIGTVIDAAHAALRRNYPELERAEVGNLIDLRNMQEVLHAVMNASGMEPVAAGEVGEVQAP
jgi:hypothetical protein